ncbi:hypothetical protein T10_8871 [Trichinella papuae]|uniref:Uncharacterized protein n=1 Tax=Trichinella papuae TaxID=268474 RepID=A0A0V1NAJ6_9BILA|nr:hypothetical protein T10_8871 [Trichinella papuae]
MSTYPAILIRLTRSTTAAAVAYDGQVAFKLDKLTEATKVLNGAADVWLALFSNQSIRQLHSEENEKKFSIDQSKTQQQQRASLDSCNWNPMTRSMYAFCLGCCVLFKNTASSP